MNYLNNKGYQIIEKIYESPNSLVYRATFKGNNKPIILKILKENYPTASELTRYKQEYEITRSLNVDSIIKAYNLQRYDNGLVMYLEDFGGKSLKLLLPQIQLTLQNFLTIAIKIIEGLAVIHTNNIIHKDINPSNIIYNPQTGQLKIIDFGISTQLSQEFLTVIPPHQLEGTLAYIAPEQTGRMNRGIDYRRDFYSLGITFYELFTNKLPFERTDPMELVHCHIAQQPLPVHELIPDIPNSVSNIVSKLLAKTPEERYQSARGIKADLEICLDKLKTSGEIFQFPLGSQDIVEKFQIPQKLYGRKQEVDLLLTTFEEVSQGKTGIIMISGYSGIGKSALVNEIHKPITQQRGEFVSGKFDQLNRDIPYSAISQGLQNLICKLLSEPEIALQTWKNKILEALGNNGQIIIDVVPEVEKIIGQQPPVEQLGAAESQKRFNLFFQKFISVFCKKEHPLTIFIDDLQWADLPSLSLIEQLMSNADNKYFLIIGAYRDNEVSHTHPLVRTLEKIKQAQIPVNEITLYPLKLNQINQLIAETLSYSTEITKPLAELVAKKTGGNAFFLIQLLHCLYKENLLVFNPEPSPMNVEADGKSYWKWDLDEIESVSITDNVVDLMVRKIEKLDKKTQQVLKLASCIGSQFNLEILAIVNNKYQTVTANELQSALNEGLICPLKNNYKVPLLWNPEDLSNKLSENYFESSKYIPYKFLHDRVQQAAYSLIPEAEKKEVHLQIGRLLLKNLEEDELQNKIFDVVNQLNQGHHLITEQLEKNELAKLNLIAGKKAKKSTAYEPALRYLETALELLSSERWKNQYHLSLEIYTEAVALQYFNSRFEQAEALSNIVLQNAQKVLDTVKIYELKIESYHAQVLLKKLVDVTFEILAKLGVDIPSDLSQQQEKIAQEQKVIALFLQDKSIAQLANLPPMTDPYKLAAVKLLVLITTSAMICTPEVCGLVTLTAVTLCLKYGNSPLASSVYCFYGLILCSMILTRDIKSGYEFGKLAYNLLNKDDIDETKPFVIMHYYSFIRHWKEPFRQISLSDFEDVIQIGLEQGDFRHTGYNIISYCLLSIFRGFNLEDCEPRLRAYGNLIKPEQEYEYYYYESCHKMALNFLKENRKNYHLLFKDSEEKENELIQSWIDNNTDWLLFISSLSKTFSAYFFKDYQRGLETVYLSEKHSRLCSSYLVYPQNVFYSALTLLAVYPQAGIEQKELILEKVREYQEQIYYFQENCSENYGNKYNLIKAEKARILGQNWQAEEFYEKAIQGAKEYEFIHEEALAYERAAEFYLALDREEIGQFYLKNAYYCYIRWGAKAKVKQLESEYPQYLLGITNPNKFQGLSARISTTGNGGEILDLTTVIKASQAISGEIQLENLLHNLMKILIENAGAQIGFLILNYQGSWVIEAQGKIDSNQVNILQSIPIEFVDPETSIPVLPTTIINYVLRTQENIVLKDATHQGQFINDPYIIARQNKSILCTPLINQGQLRGIIYLENNLTTGVFTSKRVELLNILSAQAAISIDNSRLYSQVMENQAWLDQLNKAYERFVPKQFLEFLDKESIVDVELGDQVQLEMSVLFSDVRNFTTMSEAMTPEENFRFINSFLSRMEPAILENQGFIDKYIGDAIMALFSGDADNAVKAGISMLKRLNQYNQYRASSGDSPVRIGVGINTGLLMLGTVGGQNRMDGTVISDAVNLAARVESLTKNYGVSLLITEQTFSRLTQASNYAIRPIDTVKVKGKSQKVTVYEVFDVDPPAVKEGKLNTLQRFQQAILLYKSGQLLEAREMFAECLKLNPSDQVAQIYLQRILSTGE